MIKNEDENGKINDSKVPSVVDSKALVPTTKDTTDDPLVVAAIDFINRTGREAVLRSSIDIGNYIIEHFYQNDLDLVFSRNPKKHTSLRKLKEHDDLPFHPSNLSKMINVAIQEKVFLENQINIERLNYYHHTELLRLKDDGEKLMMLDRINDEKLSGKKLREIINDIKKPITSSKHNQTEVDWSILKILLFDTPYRTLHLNESSIQKLTPDQIIVLKGFIERLDVASTYFKKIVEVIDFIEQESPPSSENESAVTVAELPQYDLVEVLQE